MDGGEQKAWGSFCVVIPPESVKQSVRSSLRKRIDCITAASSRQQQQRVDLFYETGAAGIERQRGGSHICVSYFFVSFLERFFFLYFF